VFWCLFGNGSPRVWPDPDVPGSALIGSRICSIASLAADLATRIGTSATPWPVVWPSSIPVR